MSFNDLAEYRRKILSYSKVATGTIRPGNMYAYGYEFDETKYSDDIIKFFDHMPLSFIVQVIPKHDIVQGVNLHHMPLQIREMWFKRIKLVTKIGNLLRLGKKVDRISWINYQRMNMIFRESKYAVRNYKIDNIRDLRLIALEDVEELLQYYAQTYYSTSYPQIVSQFAKQKAGK